MKLVILFALLTVCSKSNFGQCGKSSVITSSKTEYLDASYTLQRTVDEKSTVEFSKSGVIITPGDQPQMIGKIISDSCSWKQPFTEGKSVIKATFTRGEQPPINATITVEGKEGKVTMIMEMEQMPDKKIRITSDKFEEKV